MAYKAKKGPNFSVGLRWCRLSNGSQIWIIRPHTFLGDSVWQLVDLFLKKTALWWLEFYIILPKLVKDHMQSVEMFLCHPQENDYVIQVDEAIDDETILHQSLKCGWHIAQSKGHAVAFENPKLPTVKAVYCFDASSIFICQNPNLRSRHKKCPAPTRLSSTSWILSRG